MQYFFFSFLFFFSYQQVTIGQSFENSCFLPLSEAEGLESIRDSWGNSLSSVTPQPWLGNASTEGCQWYGVSCSFPTNQSRCHVVELGLSNINLSSTIPPVLQSTTFSALQVLDISHCHLAGTLPSTWSTFRPTRLNVSSNHLWGSLPLNFSGMLLSSVVDLSHNHFTGVLSDSVCHIGDFVATGNNFSCPMPSCCSPATCDRCPSTSPAVKSLWRLWVAVFIFIGVILLVLFPFSFTIRGLEITIDFAFSPWIGIVIMLASTVTDLQTVWTGFLGSPQTLQPWTIVLFFFSLAYLAVSLDKTGTLEAVARWTAMKFSASGTHLFIAMYLLAGCITILSSNDIVILTLTPIICYVCAFSKIDPIPFLYAEFFASNLFSIILIIGNPTNVIACEGTHLCSFFGYMLRMILPALVGGGAALACLYWYFRGSIPARLAQIDLKPLDAISNKYDAIIGSILVFLCLLTMSISSFLPSFFRLWIIAVIFCVLAAIKDLCFDLGDRFTPTLCPPYPSGSNGLVPVDASHPSDHEELLAEASHHMDGDAVEMTDLSTVHDTELTPHHETEPVVRELRVVIIGKKLPHKVLPFITGMFIMVEVLNAVGVIDVLAALLAPLCSNTWSAVFVIGIASTIMCNLINNQPMTIFFTRLLLSSAFQVDVNIQGALYALIVGSNLGADFTIIGALAGLMWRSILSHHHVEITYGQFARIGVIVMTLPLLLIFTTLALILSLLS